MEFKGNYLSSYGLTSYSMPFKISGKVGIPTKKFNKTTFGVEIDDDNILTLLQSENVKLYGNKVFIEKKDEQEINEIDINVCIKKFVNLKNETFNKLILQ